MRLLTKAQIVSLLLLTLAATCLAAHASSGPWLPFWLLLLAVAGSSGFKVALPQGDGTMSLNFPFILLGLLQLSPLQAMLLAGLSVAVQCRVRITKALTLLQILFNVANAMFATGVAFVLTMQLRSAGMALAPALSLGAAAYFFFNTAALAAVLASSGAGPLWEVWRTEFPWYLPFYLVGAFLAASVHWMSLRFGWSTALLLIPVVFTLYRAYTSQQIRMQERQQHLEETEALHLRTIEGLAMAIEAKDQGTHDHLFRVRHYVREVGKTLSLTKLELQALETAAFLHDIGKLAVPEHIINKPGKLTHEEFEKMKIHPVVGADILERVRFPYPVVPIVRSHHEWFNGKGYPDGLSGAAIPIGARILTVVDCFDALVSDRPYRKGLSTEKALSMIRELSGKQFDPEVVKAFEQCHAELEQEAQALVPSEFTPLNTTVAVWRGDAPGAGFAVDSAPTAAVLPTVAASVEELSTPRSAGNVASAVAVGEALGDLSRRFHDVISPADLANQIFARLTSLLPFDTLALYLRADDLLNVRFAAGRFAGQFGTDTIALGEGISGWAAQNSRPLLNGNASVEPGMPIARDGSPALRSGTAVPLGSAAGETFAVLAVYAIRDDAFRREDIAVLEAVAAPLAIALTRSLQVFPVAPNPPAVGPENLLVFEAESLLRVERRLAFCEETGGAATLIVGRLDRLGDLRKRRGSAASDKLMQQVLAAVRSLQQPGELLSRPTAETFCFCLPALEPQALEARLQVVRSRVETALQASQHGAGLPLALGTARYPEDGPALEALFAAAGRRMLSPTLSLANGPRGSLNKLQQLTAGTAR